MIFNTAISARHVKITVEGFHGYVSMRAGLLEFDNKINHCLKNKCECVNGSGAKFTDCPENGSYKCESCDFGYHLNEQTKTCDQNVCVCRNGRETVGPACHEHNARVCAADGCDDGFKHVIDATNNQLSKCLDTNCETAGQHFDDDRNECVQNTCTCLNGTPETGTNCDRHQSEECDVCDAGYQREGFRCSQKQCKCYNGNPVSSIHCSQTNANECSSCDPGYHLLNGAMGGTCTLNICRCLNGVETTGTACPTNNEEMCQRCNNGYHLYFAVVNKVLT